MADGELIRIKSLPVAGGTTAPVPTDAVGIDGATTRQTTIQQLVDTGAPVATKAEAESGVDATKRMTPLTVRQSIAANAATKSQGDLAETALQPAEVGTAAYSNANDFATSLQGDKADTSLQTGDDVSASSATPTFTGGAPYVLRLINEKELNLMMFGPSYGSGVDVSAALQALINSASSTGKTARVSAHPSGYAWRVAATLSVPTVKLLFDPSSKTEIYAALPLFQLTDSNVLIDGGGTAAIVHYGGGKILDTNQKDSVKFRGFKLDATLADTSTDDMICVSGSDTYITDLHCGSFRGNGFVARMVKKAGHLCINNRISEIYMGGTGKGLIVTSEDGTNRPEGLTVRGIKSVLTAAEIMRVESVYSMVVDDAMLDQGSGYVVNLVAVGAGIQDLTINNSYIAAAQNTTGDGVAIRATNNAIPIIGLDITSNEIAYSDYGIACLGDNVSGLNAIGNSFRAIDQTAIQGLADDWTLRDNTYDTVTRNVNISEGAGGGSITIDNERFSPSATISLPATITRSRWNIGRTFGKILRRSLTITVSAPTNNQYVYIAHGLFRAPPAAGITGLSAVVATGTYDDMRVSVVAIDATNITVQIKYTTQVTSGSVTINLDASV